VHGRWFIHGGSKWQFEEPAEPHDYALLFELNLGTRRWFTIDPRPGPAGELLAVPPWAVGSALVPLGSCQVLSLGGAMPQHVGPEGIRETNLVNWRRWYNRLDEPYLLDLATMSWSKQSVPCVPSGAPPITSQELHVAEVFLRGQFAAVFVPGRRSVVVFGGSRYFTGEYFHDLLELRLPGASSLTQSTPLLGAGFVSGASLAPLGEFRNPARLPRFLARGNQQRLTRGLIGRLRGLLRDQLLPRVEYDRILDALLPAEAESDEIAADSESEFETDSDHDMA